jgi:predicted AlkP superfamily phosphohydrolase/phosphomutase
VDWGRTRAYALGLGSVYLNLRGRESGGIVDPSEADAVSDEIARGLTGLRDEERGRVAIRGVARARDVYRGAFAHQAPDLVVRFAAAYRVSWATALGGIPDGTFENNERKWGGDHIIDPDLVPGVLFMNRRFHEEGAHIVDLAPTLVGALGVPRGQQMEGRDLFDATSA